MPRFAFAVEGVDPRRPHMNLHDYDDWLTPLATALGAALAGILAYLILRPIARRISRHAEGPCSWSST